MQACSFQVWYLTSELYGIEYASYNVHILQHLPFSVEEWGPLTYSSAFLFEDACGVLLTLFAGTQAVPQQIIKHYLALRRLQTVGQFWLEGCDEQIAFFFEDLTKCNLNMQVQKAYRVNSCMALGTASFRKLSVLERMLVEDVFDNRLPDRACAFFQRIVVNKRLHSTADYVRQFKQDNSIASLSSNEFCQIVSIVVIKLCTCTDAICNCAEEVLCFVRIFKKQGSQSTCFDKFVDVNLTRFFIRCILDTQLHVVRLSQIVGKGFACRINNVWSIIQVPSFELD